MYHKLFNEEEQEFDITEYEPKDMQDVQKMLGELRRMGFD